VIRLGLGAIFAPRGTYPIQRALAESGVDRGPDGPPHEPDEWIERLGALPLVHQPGAGTTAAGSCPGRRSS
jgi:hypothetical protein